MDLYTLKKELIDLSKSSCIFDNFEKETRVIDKYALVQIQDLSLLMKIKNLASEIKNKKVINDKLDSLHFNLSLLKNSTESSASTIKNVFHIFLYNDETKIETLINELNDFKTKLEKIKYHRSRLFPKSLDNKLKIEDNYSKYFEQLHSIHKKQKDIFILLVNSFLDTTKNHIKTLQKFKKRD